MRVEGLGQHGLLEDFAGLVEISVALKDVLRRGKFGQVGVGQLVGFLRSEFKAFGGEPDGGSHDALEAQLAVFAFGVDQAGHRAGRGDGAVAEDAGIGDDVAVRVQVHVLRGGEGAFSR